MKRRHDVNIHLFAIICVLMISCANEKEEIFFDVKYDLKEDYSEMELEVLDLINKYRMSKNLQSLNKLNSISSVALSHTNYMVETGLVNHDNFPARKYYLTTNENASSVGENVAYGYFTTLGVVNAWINSEKHKAIIENNNYTDFGISIEKNSEGKNYYTQIFIELKFEKQ